MTEPTKIEEGVFLPAVDLSKIHYSKDNPRKHVDQAQLKELAASIKEHGVVQPIVIRAHPKLTGEYDLIAGERRHRGSVIAGRATVPAVLRVYTDQQAAEVRQIENLQRADVHPMDEAHGFHLLISKFEYTVDLIAQKISKEPRYVVKRMKLVDLIELYQKLFWAGDITIGYAEFLCRLPEDVQKELSKQYPNSYTWQSLSNMQRQVQNMAYNDVSKAPWGMKDALAGMIDCASCPQRSGNAELLFPELNKTPNICTNRVCFKLKLDAHITRALEKKPDLVSISQNYNQPPKGVLAQDKYKELGKEKSCGHAVSAIVVIGNSTNEGVGKITKICYAKDCKVHAAVHSSGRSGPDPAYAAQQRKWRLAQVGRNAAFKAISDAPAAKVKMGIAETQELALYLFDRSYNRDKIAMALDWEKVKGNGSHRYVSTAKKFIETAPLPELHKLIMMLVLSPMLMANNYGPNESLARVFDFGKRWGVDARKAHDNAVKQLQDKFAKRANSAKKSGKAKARK